MEPYDLKAEGDLGALSDEQQEKLNQFKVWLFKRKHIPVLLKNMKLWNRKESNTEHIYVNFN